MRLALLALPLAALSLVGSACAADPDAVKKELAKLEGTWQLKSYSVVGKAKTAAELAKTTAVFEGGTITIKSEGRPPEKSEIALDPAAKPKAIDVRESKTAPAVKGIYELDGDKLKICARVPNQGERPTEFATEGDTLVVMSFERAKK